MKRCSSVEVEVLVPSIMGGWTDDAQPLLRHGIEKVIALVMEDVEQSALGACFEFQIPFAPSLADLFIGVFAFQLVWKPLCQNPVKTDAECDKALADPTRRRVLQLLRERDMSAGELAEQQQCECLDHGAMITAIAAPGQGIAALPAAYP